MLTSEAREASKVSTKVYCLYDKNQSRFCSNTCDKFLNEFLDFEAALTLEDILIAFVNILEAWYSKSEILKFMYLYEIHITYCDLFSIAVSCNFCTNLFFFRKPWPSQRLPGCTQSSGHSQNAKIHKKLCKTLIGYRLQYQKFTVCLQYQMQAWSNGNLST